MYSPKIYQKHIPVLYHLAKRKGVPMTRLVNQIIEQYLNDMEGALRSMETKEITKNLFERRQSEKKQITEKAQAMA